MHELATSDSQKSRANRLPIIVVSERALVRDLVVDFLRRHGFPEAAGRTTLGPSLQGSGREVRGLVFVDLENGKEDVRQLLQQLHAQTGAVRTVAIGTPIQLAAHAQGADGWIEVSEPASRMTEVAGSIAHAWRKPPNKRVSLNAERWSRTWRTLTNRQRQVLALLGCGLDNHKLADALRVSERAVKAHVSVLLDKFKVDSRTELALIACHAGLFAPAAGTSWRH